MDLQLSNEAALVTGGGRGIGQAIAVALAREGVHVAVCGRTREPLEATAELVGGGDVCPPPPLPLTRGRTCLSDERITSVMQDVVQRALFNAG